jgi:hypothetical protein
MTDILARATKLTPRTTVLRQKTYHIFFLDDGKTQNKWTTLHVTDVSLTGNVQNSADEPDRTGKIIY